MIRTEQMDAGLATFAEMISAKEKAATRAIEMGHAEIELCKELHIKLSNIIASRFGIDPSKQKFSISYKDKLIQIEDIQNG